MVHFLPDTSRSRLPDARSWQSTEHQKRESLNQNRKNEIDITNHIESIGGKCYTPCQFKKKALVLSRCADEKMKRKASNENETVLVDQSISVAGRSLWNETENKRSDGSSDSKEDDGASIVLFYQYKEPVS